MKMHKPLIGGRRVVQSPSMASGQNWGYSLTLEARQEGTFTWNCLSGMLYKPYTLFLTINKGRQNSEPNNCSIKQNKKTVTEGDNCHKATVS